MRRLLRMVSQALIDVVTTAQICASRHERSLAD
jgi:hypothetical protein